MTRTQRRIRISWLKSIARAIQLGESDAAYNLTVGFVRRLREVGAL